jgi:ubiquinone biosynthesis protein COQ9
LAERGRDQLIEAMLPDVPFDGWSSRTLRTAAGRVGMPTEEASALFPGGSADMVAAFSRWADRHMLDRLEGASLDELRVSQRVSLALRLRFEVLTPHREAVRRSMSVLALPFNTPLGMLLLYETVDAIWYAVGDASTDISFYTKRAMLAGVLAAATLYWLEDRSTGSGDTLAFIERRLADLHRLTNFRQRFQTTADRMPNPARLLRGSR